MIYHTGPLKDALLCWAPLSESGLSAFMSSRWELFKCTDSVEVLMGQIKFFVKSNLPERIQILFRVEGAAI